MSLFLSLLACKTDPAPEVVYHPDVQARVDEHCSVCHRPGGQTPMALDTYEAAATWADAMLAAVRAGDMPPWHADPSCRHFAGERLLPDDFLPTLASWITAGKPEGDVTNRVDVVVAPDTSWQPTWTASVPGYVPSDEEIDDWRCFVLPEIVFDEETWITAADLAPGTAKVHHALVFALGPDQAALALAGDAAADGAGYPCVGGVLPGVTASPDLVDLASASGSPEVPMQLGTWVPGIETRPFDDGSAYRVAPGSLVVLQVHYNFQTASPEPDTSTLALLATRERPSLLRKTAQIFVADLDIAAGASDASFTASTPYHGAGPIEIVGFTGHMHQLAVSMSARASSTDGEACLVDIPDWDFHWQQQYRLPISDKVVIGSGTHLELTCTYDNSAENQPIVQGQIQAPRDVTWGESSTDEMCLLLIERVEPYAPMVEPDPDAPACASCPSCSDGDTACAMSCGDSTFACTTCLVSAASTCAPTCLAPLLTDTDCVESCLVAAALLDGNVGMCLAAECPERLATLGSCMDDAIAAGTCAEALAPCGL